MPKSFTLRLDGTWYEIESHGNAITVNGRRYEPEISGSTVRFGESKLAVEVDGTRAFVDGIEHAFETEGLEERSAASHAGHHFGVDTNGALTAIMPGLIIKVLAQPGAKVAEGDVVVILEAMKMENEICAPKEGTIKEIRVKAGESVAQNQVLAVVE
jgi:biotin carboxyl carrier protein